MLIMMDGMMGGMMAVWLLVIVLLMLIVLGVILFTVWGARRFGDQNAGVGNGEETPLSIIQHRYARGEISREEYERIRSDLIRDGARR